MKVKNRRKSRRKVPNPITVYTDGSADVKANASGYGYLVLDSAGQVLEEGSGSLTLPNNTYAEIKAVIIGMEAAGKYAPTELTVYTDYNVIPAILKQEIRLWQKRGWKTSKGQDIKFADLWKKLKEMSKAFNADIRWVKGHSGNLYNERCDYLAWNAMRNAAENGELLQKAS